LLLLTFLGGPRRGRRFRFLLLVTLLARVGGLRSRGRLLVVALLEGEARRSSCRRHLLRVGVTVRTTTRARRRLAPGRRLGATGRDAVRRAVGRTLGCRTLGRDGMAARPVVRLGRGHQTS